MKIDLSGQTALVTGASRGIGRTIAQSLARAGADLVLMGRDQTSLEQLAQELMSDGCNAEIAVCDVQDVPAIFRAIAGLPKLNILVNNAGTNIPEPFAQVSEEHFDQIINLNLRATFFVTQAAVQKILSTGAGGAIINISSQMGHVGAANRSVYCASKHALEGFTKALAVELAPQHIRVVSVAPTFIETDLTRPFLEQPEFQQSVIASIPLGHTGTPEDVAHAVAFLASSKASLITGSSLLVAGGWTAL